jgi:hypothetical protein
MMKDSRGTDFLHVIDASH